MDIERAVDAAGLAARSVAGDRPSYNCRGDSLYSHRRVGKRCLELIHSLKLELTHKLLSRRDPPPAP